MNATFAKHRAERRWHAALAAMAIIGMTAMPAHAAEVTLIGEINDTYQLVADGQIYEIAETPAGEDLVRNYISLKVKVVGTVSSEGEVPTITVRSFEPVDE